MIAPHRRNRTQPKTQDGRALRRYKRRWKVERLWAWLQNFRRVLVRHERHVHNYLGFVYLGCLVILLRTFFGGLLVTSCEAHYKSIFLTQHQTTSQTPCLSPIFEGEPQLPRYDFLPKV